MLIVSVRLWDTLDLVVVVSLIALGSIRTEM